ncbi:MAG: shikimate kinase [Desulfuromonadales bacterium]|nr:shikimate kinase [Desulfuromonadales bacterium]
MNNNIILIGMPGAGKSTVGVILAKRLGFDFVDTDLLIQSRCGARLQQIIDTHGLPHFREIEEQTLIDLDVQNSVVATGGSVIYCPRGMEALAGKGVFVYLQVPLTNLEQRLADMGQRGLVMRKGQTLAHLYQQRVPLYEKYAQLTQDCTNLNAEQVAGALEAALNRYFYSAD